MCMTAMGGVGRDEFEEDVDSSMENRALYESGSNADPLSHFMRGEVDHFRACPAGVSDGLPDDDTLSTFQPLAMAALHIAEPR